MYHVWAFLMAIGFGVPLAAVMELEALGVGMFCGALDIFFTLMIHGL